MSAWDLQDAWARWHQLRGAVVESKPEHLSFVDETLADSQRYGGRESTEKMVRDSAKWLEGMLTMWGVTVPAPEPESVTEPTPVHRQDKTALAVAEEQARAQEQADEPDQGEESAALADALRETGVATEPVTVTEMADRRPKTQPEPVVPPQGPSPALVPRGTAVWHKVWMPDAVFNQGLTPYEFTVYAYLCRRAGKSGTAWPKLTLIAAECGLYRETVTAAVNRLEELQMVSRKRTAFGGANVYQIRPPEEWLTVSGSEPPTVSGLKPPNRGRPVSGCQPLQ